VEYNAPSAAPSNNSPRWQPAATAARSFCQRFRWIAFSERDSFALRESSRSENAIHLGHCARKPQFTSDLAATLINLPGRWPENRSWADRNVCLTINFGFRLSYVWKFAAKSGAIFGP